MVKRNIWYVGIHQECNFVRLSSLKLGVQKVHETSCSIVKDIRGGLKQVFFAFTLDIFMLPQKNEAFLFIFLCVAYSVFFVVYTRCYRACMNNQWKRQETIQLIMHTRGGCT